MLRKKPLILIVALVLVFCTAKGTGVMNMPDNGDFLTTGYYVVIGAYAKSKEYYAKRYTEQVRKKGYEANYGFSQKRNYYFVYLLYTGNYRASISKMREVRGIEGFDEAWVYVSLEESVITPTASVGSDQQEAGEAGVSEEQAEKSTASGNINADETIASDTERTEQGPSSSQNEEGDTEQTAQVEEQPEDGEQGASSDKSQLTTLADATVLFNLYNVRNNNDVEGEIQVIDSERSKLIKVVRGGDYIKLPDPKNGTGRLTLICDVFGYRKIQKDINYYDPLWRANEEGIDILTDVYVVNFGLPRYHAGDIVTMYNVYFYNDAALMRPESKYEINSLQAMLEENPDYKIRIHGHVNGKHPGKIISRGESSLFFALNDSNKEGFGTARELSRQRAEIIRDYLNDNGIDESRMEIKAWGGRRMLHDKHSTSARRNVRVEIEILEE